eukprot:gene4499-5611_t
MKTILSILIVLSLILCFASFASTKNHYYLVSQISNSTCINNNKNSTTVSSSSPTTTNSTHNNNATTTSPIPTTKPTNATTIENKNNTVSNTTNSHPLCPTHSIKRINEKNATEYSVTISFEDGANNSFAYKNLNNLVFYGELDLDNHTLVVSRVYRELPSPPVNSTTLNNTNTTAPKDPLSTIIEEETDNLFNQSKGKDHHKTPSPSPTPDNSTSHNDSTTSPTPTNSAEPKDKFNHTTPSPTQSNSPTPTPTHSSSPTPTPTHSNSPTPTPTHSNSPTPSPTHSTTPTPSPTEDKANHSTPSPSPTQDIIPPNPNATDIPPKPKEENTLTTYLFLDALDGDSTNFCNDSVCPLDKHASSVDQPEIVYAVNDIKDPYTKGVPFFDSKWYYNRMFSNKKSDKSLSLVSIDGDGNVEVQKTYVVVPDPTTKSDCDPISQDSCLKNLVQTFERKGNRCLKFKKCELANKQKKCKNKNPECAPGYKLVSFYAGSHACRKYICDADFLEEISKMPLPIS